MFEKLPDNIAVIDNFGLLSLRTKASIMLFIIKNGAKHSIVDMYALVMANVDISAPKIPAKNSEPNVPIITKTSLIIIPALMHVENTILASLSCF